MRILFSALLLLILLTAIPAHAAEPAPAPEPPDPAIVEQLTELGYEYEMDEEGDFRLLFDMGEERSQFVWIRNRTYSADGVAMRDVWSYALELPGKYVSVKLASRLLLESWEGIMGGWARDGEYVVYMVKLPADAAAAKLDAAIGEAIRAADALEKERRFEDDF